MKQVAEVFRKKNIELSRKVKSYFLNVIKKYYLNIKNKNQKNIDSFANLEELYKEILNFGKKVDEQRLRELCKNALSVLPEKFEEWIGDLKELKLLKCKEMIAYYMSLTDEELKREKNNEKKMYDDLAEVYKRLNSEFFESGIPSSNIDNSSNLNIYFYYSINQKVPGDVFYMFCLMKFVEYDPKKVAKWLQEWKNKSLIDDNCPANELIWIYQSLCSRIKKLETMTLEEFKQYKMHQLSSVNDELLEMIKSEIIEEYNKANPLNPIIEKNDSCLSESGTAK